MSRKSKWYGEKITDLNHIFYDLVRMEIFLIFLWGNESWDILTFWYFVLEVNECWNEDIKHLAVATTNLIIWSNTTLYGYFCWKLHQHLQRWQTTHIVNFPIFVPRNEDVKIINMFHSWKTGFLTFRYIEIFANIL